MLVHADFYLPDIKKNAHVGILGGSFDPPHLCHELLALSFLALEPISDLWVIPCANHAFKGNLTSFAHRLAMCQIAFSRLNNVHVLPLEENLPTPNFTINTVEAILQKRPDIKIYFGLGSDLIASFEQWHRATELALATEIVIFERESFAINYLPPSLNKARIHNGYILPNANSTNVRQFLSRKPKEAEPSFLDRAVFDYINNNNLYKN